MATYNGHKNWNHWNVALWLANDELSYELARAVLKDYPTMRAATLRLLDLLDSHTPDGAPYTFTSVRAALRGMR